MTVPTWFLVLGVSALFVVLCLLVLGVMGISRSMNRYDESE